MNLTEEPVIVQWPETHYVFIEKVGPFMETAPAAWGELHGNVAAIEQNNKIRHYFSLYKTGPKIYRAGVGLSAPPIQLPGGLRYEHLPSGKYSRFVLTGPYTELGPASGRVWQIAAEKIEQRNDFAVENYCNDPRTTSEDQLVTEILIPTV
jgi:effector-binding domain-containing protein